MIALIQRVRRADVRVGERVTGEIGAGLLALVCAERGDTDAVADKLLAKLLAQPLRRPAAVRSHTFLDIGIETSCSQIAVSGGSYDAAHPERSWR